MEDDIKIIGNTLSKDLSTRHPHFSPSSLHISKKDMIVSSESRIIGVERQRGTPGWDKSNEVLSVGKPDSLGSVNVTHNAPLLRKGSFLSFLKNHFNTFYLG